MTPPKVDSAHLEEAGALLLEGGLPMMTALGLFPKLKTGQLRALIARSQDGAAAFVVNERGPWRQVVAAEGQESALLAGLTELLATSDALLWDEGVVKLEDATLDGLGFRLLHRQVFTQELARVPLADPEPAELEVLPLSRAVHGEARSLFGRTHAMSIDGLYATLPEAPSVQNCEAAFDGYLEGGGQGAHVPSACVVIRSQGRIVGVICCAATKTAGTAVLLGLAVDPSERGRGLSRVLVRRAQRALKAAGFERMLFLTTDRNTPVHRLFTADEIVSTETFPARLWFRQPPQPSTRRS